MLKLMLKLVLYLAQCGFRLWKLTIALTFRCVSSLCSAAATSAHSSNETSSSRNSSTATAQQSNNTDTIAKLDLIEALDSEIAVLAQEKQFYEQQLQQLAAGASSSSSSKLSTEKQLKAQHKVAQLNTRMMVLTRRVLKLREELENGKTSI